MHTVVDCGELDNPNNGQVSLDGIIFGSIATYTCDTGFNLIGDMERICQANGNWSESEPVCQSQFYTYIIYSEIPFKLHTHVHWHAIKDSLTHRPSSQGWAPGVLPFYVQVCCLSRVCTWMEGWGVEGDFFLFYYLASLL